MTTDAPPSQAPASPEASGPRRSKFQPVMQIELSSAKAAAPGKTSPSGAGAEPAARAVPPAVPYWPRPRFRSVIQVPAPVHAAARARRWKLHGGRVATGLGVGAVVLVGMMGLTLLWPTLRPARGVAFANPPPAASPGALRTTATRALPTATRALPTATPAPLTTAGPDLAATLSVAIAATLTAQPTAAGLPTAAPSITPVATMAFLNQGGLAGTTTTIFNETFHPGGYWDVGDTPYAQREISNGQLHLHIKNIGSISWSFNAISADNFYVQGSTTVTACRAGDYYGLVYRVKDDSNFYMFGTTCDGRYRAVRQKDGQFTNLVDYTFSPDVVTNGGYNLLGVRAAGDQFSFYVNDQLMTTTTDDTFTAGRFGVFAKSFETPNLTVNFYDITAWNLNP